MLRTIARKYGATCMEVDKHESFLGRIEAKKVIERGESTFTGSSPNLDAHCNGEESGRDARY